MLPISQNEALFALLGTTYGGDGTTTFALPNLQSRVPIHQGHARGSQTTSRPRGRTETVKLTATQMPSHTHSVEASSSAATSNTPKGSALAQSASHIYTAQPDTSTVMNANMIGHTGGSAPHTNIQPYLAVNFCIALTGIFLVQS